MTRAFVACLHALADSSEPAIVFGGTDNPPDDVLVLPPPERLQSFAGIELSIVRGLADSCALMHRYHDTELHSSRAPAEDVARRLYTLLERERYEAIGARQYAGIAGNLLQLWLHAHDEAHVERLGGAEKLELVLACLCREALSGRPLPARVAGLVAATRAPVESLVGDTLQWLAANVDDQPAYAAHALALIEKLGFDTSLVSSDGAVQTGDDTAQNMAGPGDDTDASAADADDNARGRIDTTVANDEVTPAADCRAQILVRNTFVTEEREPDPAVLHALTERETPDSCGGSAQQQEKLPGYRVAAPGDDEIVRAATLASGSELAAWRMQLDQYLHRQPDVSRLLVGRLQRLLLSRQNRRWEYDQEEGELDTHRLTRRIMDPGHPLTFRREVSETFNDTVVSVLIDNSRSMHGRPITIAACCADLLARTLERCGVRCEVLGFTTVNMYSTSGPVLSASDATRRGPGRLNQTRHIIYKSASDTWRRARLQFGLMLMPDLLKQNIDGEALQWACTRLVRRAESRRILLVISDGVPSDSATLNANGMDYLVGHLRQVIAQIESSAKIELSAIGIGHPVGAYYRRATTIRNVDELGKVLLEELDRLFPPPH